VAVAGLTEATSNSRVAVVTRSAELTPVAGVTGFAVAYDSTWHAQTSSLSYEIGEHVFVK